MREPFVTGTFLVGLNAHATDMNVHRTIVANACTRIVGSSQSRVVHIATLSLDSCMSISHRLSVPILIALICGGCTEQADVQPAKDGMVGVKLALNWYPEVEHGGFIAAEALGLYDAEKLDVELVPGGPGAPQLVISELAAERILFAVSDADNVVKARASGYPIVAVLAPLQDSPRCIMVHQDSGFKTLEDVADIELAISETRPFALWMKKKLPLKNVRLIPFSGSVGEFLLKKEFAQQAFVFSEPFAAKEQGSDPQTMMVSDIGFNPYASLLVTTEKSIRERPELVRSMISASVAGWGKYLADPSAGNAAIYAMSKNMSPAALEFGASAMAPLCKVRDNEPLCNMTLQRWKALVVQIEEVEDIKPGSVKAEECFTTEFLLPAKTAE